MNEMITYVAVFTIGFLLGYYGGGNNNAEAY